MTAILELDQINKMYRTGSAEINVLKDVSLTLGYGESAAVVGPSGSGKTTLLSLCAGLDNPSSGRIRLLGTELGSLSEDERARMRNRNIGFIFQSFHLMPSLTALENVVLPLELGGGENPMKQAETLLGQVGLGDRMTHYPAQLSGGEQQRVAIARAFINQPKILFADEPTGNLDRETSRRITGLLFDLNRQRGTTLLLITHDPGLAEHTRRLFHIDNGMLSEKTTELAVDHETTAAVGS